MTMKPRHQVSRAAVALIKRFEGFRAKAAELEDGRWTIGYGHTKTARGGTEIAEADAEALLLYDLINVAHAVNEWTYAPLNQNQFDALVSFAFNIGLENFRRSTTLRRVNEGRMLEAALTMELWRRADFEGERIVVDALVRRRAYEKILFLTPVDEWAPAPSPVLPPKIDYEVAPFTLTAPPAVLKTEMTGGRAVAARDHAAPVRLAPLEDTGPTASELAADAVRARLQALVPAEDAAPSPLIAEAPEPVTLKPAADRPAPVAEPPEALDFPGRGDEEAPRDIDNLPTAEAAAPSVNPEANAVSDAISADGDLKLDDKPAGVRKPLSLWVWAAMLAIGVALFTAAVKWGFRPSAPTVLGVGPVTVSWIVGALGIATAAPALLNLMARLGGED
jgi:lysozyme